MLSQLTYTIDAVEHKLYSRFKHKKKSLYGRRYVETFLYILSIVIRFDGGTYVPFCF